MPRRKTRLEQNSSPNVKILLFATNGNHCLRFTADFDGEHYTETVSVQPISLQQLLQHRATNQTGLFCVQFSSIYYAEHPCIFNFGTHTFDLQHDAFECVGVTIACLKQVTYYTKLDEKVASTKIECNENVGYSLNISYVVTATTYAEITRKVGDNPKQDRKKALSTNVVKRWNRTDVFSFKEVTRDELFQLRLTKEPALAYKKNDKLYYAPVPESLKDDLDITVRPVGVLKTHLCNAGCSRVCVDCPRTTDLTIPYQLKYDNSFENAVNNSWRPEKYAFMHEALESFNMAAGLEALLVLRCSAYRKKG